VCPVCRARFRGASECPRCGADLRILMLLQVQAWRLRQAARRAILEGNLPRALGLSSAAEAIYHTPAGKRLKSLSSWLSSGESGDRRDPVIGTQQPNLTTDPAERD
jgi:hypothetical protein